MGVWDYVNTRKKLRQDPLPFRLRNCEKHSWPPPRPFLMDRKWTRMAFGYCLSMVLHCLAHCSLLNERQISCQILNSFFFLELFFDFSDEKLRCFMLCCKNSFTLIGHRCNREWNGFTMAWRWCIMHVVYWQCGYRDKVEVKGIGVIFCLVFSVIMVMCF